MSMSRFLILALLTLNWTHRARSAGDPPFGDISRAAFGPDTELSLGGIYEGSHARSHSTTMEASASVDAALHMAMSSSLLPARSGQSPPLQAFIDIDDLQMRLARQEQQNRLEYLRDDLHRHFDKNWEVWPAIHTDSQGRPVMYVPTVKKRALGAFTLREKYRDLLDPSMPETVWSLEQYQRWHDSIPDRYPRLRQVSNTHGYEQVERDVDLIEKILKEQALMA